MALESVTLLNVQSIIAKMTTDPHGIEFNISTIERGTHVESYK
jgi:hypothetical protein